MDAGQRRKRLASIRRRFGGESDADVQWLVTEAEVMTDQLLAAEAENDRLTERLRPYADPANWRVGDSLMIWAGKENPYIWACDTLDPPKVIYRFNWCSGGSDGGTACFTDKVTADYFAGLLANAGWSWTMTEERVDTPVETAGE